MKKIITYVIEEDVAIAIKKITGNINDIDFKDKFKLSEKEMKLIHEFYDFIQENEE